jgi:hypothetical protein
MDDLADKYSMDRNIIDKTMALLRNPSFRPMLERKATEFWGVWVSSWLAYDFTKTSVLQFEGEFELPTGQVVTGPWEAVHHGPDKEHEGCVRVSVTGKLGGKKLVEAFKVAFGELSNGVPHSEPIPDDVLEAMSVEVRVWAVLRPETMQPVEAYSERRILVDTTAERTEQVESRHYTFSWH